MPYAPISAASSGANEIVAAAAGQTIRVLSYVLDAAGAVTAKWQSASSDRSGAMSLITGTPVVCPPGPQLVAGRAAYLETAPGEALNLTLGGAVQVSGHIEYERRTV